MDYEDMEFNRMKLKGLKTGVWRNYKSKKTGFTVTVIHFQIDNGKYNDFSIKVSSRGKPAEIIERIKDRTELTIVVAPYLFLGDRENPKEIRFELKSIISVGEINRPKADPLPVQT